MEATYSKAWTRRQVQKNGCSTNCAKLREDPSQCLCSVLSLNRPIIKGRMKFWQCLLVRNLSKELRSLNVEMVNTQIAETWQVPKGRFVGKREIRKSLQEEASK